MYFEKTIADIKDNNSSKKIAIFVDMDGVIADYNVSDVSNIKKHVSGVYANKRPIYTIIEILRKISKSGQVDLYILSSCLSVEQHMEKENWLNKYAPFFTKNKRIIIIENSFNKRSRLKITKIWEKISTGECDLAILIDDTYEILALSKYLLKDKIIPFHVASILD